MKRQFAQITTVWGCVFMAMNAGTKAAISSTTSSCVREVSVVSFKDPKGRAMSALRLVDQTGAEGCWVGDFLRGMDQPEGQAGLDKIKRLDAAHPEAAWDEMGRRGLHTPLGRAADIAVWDLHGRRLGKPVGALLGPAKRDKVKFYMANFPDMTAAQNAQAIKEAQERKVLGFKIYTYFPRPHDLRDPESPEAAKYVESDIQLARALREAAPEGVKLMFFNGNSYNLNQALKVGAVLDELRYDLFCDPMPVKGDAGMAAYRQLREKIKTPICSPLNGGSLEDHIAWIESGATDMGETDLYAGFTTCLRFIRECAKRGVALDLHAGFPMDLYHFPLYGFVDDATLPWIGWHGRSLKAIPAATEFKGAEVKPPKQPWLKRSQTRPVDAEGYVHIVYEIPGMGLEPDWEWIRQNEIKK